MIDRRTAITLLLAAAGTCVTRSDIAGAQEPQKAEPTTEPNPFKSASSAPIRFSVTHTPVTHWAFELNGLESFKVRWQGKEIEIPMSEVWAALGGAS